MSFRKKLSDEAYANEYVIHQNACADRKLQRELHHLERLQETQRRRLDQSLHYFDVLHKVVPIFDPLNEPERKERMANKRPLLQKRHTEPSIVRSQLTNSVKSRVGSEIKLIPRSVKSEKEITYFKSISGDSSYNSRQERSEHENTRKLKSGNINHHANEQPSPNALDRSHQLPECKSRHMRTHHLSNFQRNKISQGDETERMYASRNLAWPKSAGQEEELYVKGRVSHLNEKILEKSGSHKKRSSDRRTTDLIPKTESFDDMSSNKTYDQTTTSDSVSISSFSTEHGYNDAQSQRVEFKERSVSINSNQSDGDPSSEEDEKEEDEKFPSVLSEKVTLRISGNDDKSKELKMLYQLRDGHVEVPKTNETRQTLSRTIERNGESITIDDLSLNKRFLGKSVSLESNVINRQRNGAKKTTQNAVKGGHMTFVKFLPKSKQASYLSKDNQYPTRLCNSWHAGQSTHF